MTSASKVGHKEAGLGRKEAWDDKTRQWLFSETRVFLNLAFSGKKVMDERRNLHIEPCLMILRE